MGAGAGKSLWVGGSEWALSCVGGAFAHPGLQLRKEGMEQPDAQGLHARKQITHSDQQGAQAGVHRQVLMLLGSGV